VGVRAGSLLSRVVLAAVLAAVLLVLATAGAIWWTARQDARPSSDAIVVLGSAQYDGVPSPIFEARLEHALALYQAGVAPVVVTVGGKAEGDRMSEAEAGAEYLVQAGVPGEALLPVPEGADTLESMRSVSRVFGDQGWSTAVLVTDPWHALRTERMAEDSGIEADTSPTRQGPSVYSRTTQVRYILRETAAYLLYRATGESVAGAPGIG
jgi:uncharacterized SAM-binding protein YcdF (DUF218 family)